VEPKAPVEERNKTKIPEAKDRPSDDVLRRVRNGKDAPDIRRTQPPPTKDDSMQNGQRQMPPYPPPYPTDPKERERFEKMMEQYGPPPGYYPPPSGYPPPPSGYPPPGAFPPSPYPDDYNQPYDAPYDYGEQYYDEYEPEYDFNSRFDSTKTNDQKTATFHDERAVDLAADEYPVIDDQDDYIDSDLE
jgi:hypothetical protein